jgi:hypothetical protein
MSTVRQAEAGKIPLLLQMPDESPLVAKTATAEKPPRLKSRPSFHRKRRFEPQL